MIYNNSKIWILLLTILLVLLGFISMSWSGGALGGANSASGGGHAAWGSPDRFMDAINKGWTFKRTNWNASVLEDEHPYLRLERVLWSAKPRVLPLTVFTQLPVERINALFDQCSSFTGPLSAVVYLSLVEPAGSAPQALSKQSEAKVHEAVGSVERLHAKTEALPGGCALDVMLMWEVFDSDQSRLLYPVNYLLNYARLQVRTNLVSMIDVDMVISSSLSGDLLQHPDRAAWYEQSTKEGRTAFVIPAFEPLQQGPAGRDMVMRAAQADKTALRQLHDKSSSVMQFKKTVFPRGHTPTDYARWWKASAPYPVSYKLFYEPWFISHWDVMPWYDVRFRGYGVDKSIQVASLAYYNVSLTVLPHAWILQSPHEDTVVHKVVAREALPKRGAVRGGYQPMADPRHMAAFGALPWLKRPPVLHARHCADLDNPTITSDKAGGDIGALSGQHDVAGVEALIGRLTSCAGDLAAAGGSPPLAEPTPAFFPVGARWLVYFVIGGEPANAELLRYSLNTLRSWNDNIDTLAICDADFAPHLAGMPLTHVHVCERNADHIQASMRKLEIFRWPGIDAYDAVLFMDSAVVVSGDLRPVFELVTRDDVLYVVPEANAQHRSRYFECGDAPYTDEEIARFAKDDLSPFNAGQFAFRASPAMRAHFEKLCEWKGRYDPKLHYYEQGFLNAHFNRAGAVDSSLSRHVLLFAQWRLAADPGPMPQGVLLAHFSDERLQGASKLAVMRECHRRALAAAPPRKLESRALIASALAGTLPPPPAVAEIGSFRGDFAALLLKSLAPRHLTLIDPWVPGPVTSGDADGNYKRKYDGETNFRKVRDRFKAEVASGRMRLLRNFSTSITAAEVPPASLDLLYVDGDHSYEGVRDELPLVVQWVKPGGWLTGHDYDTNKAKARNHYNFGVKRAVDEFCVERGLRVRMLMMDGLVSFVIRL